MNLRAQLGVWNVCAPLWTAYICFWTVTIKECFHREVSLHTHNNFSHHRRPSSQFAWLVSRSVGRKDTTKEAALLRQLKRPYHGALQWPEVWQVEQAPLRDGSAMAGPNFSRYNQQTDNYSPVLKETRVSHFRKAILRSTMNEFQMRDPRLSLSTRE